MQANNGPVVLTWDEDPRPDSTVAGGQPEPSSSRATPADNPPTYETASKPTKTVAYSFSPSSFNSMILIPPPDAQDTRPRYFISVHTNCFVPCSWITNLYRGSNEYGHHVGDFEMGLSVEADTVCIKGREQPASQRLLKEYFHTTYLWKWVLQERTTTRRRVALTWNTNKKGSHSCSLTPPGELDAIALATFMPKKELRVPNQPAPLARLEVTPDGHDYFDDIVMSLLMIERTRLTRKF